MEELLTELQLISEIAGAIDNGHIKSTADMLRQKIKAQSLNLVILGQFKRGKTTAINALLGDKILPSAIIPLTSIITKLVYSDQKSAKVYFLSGSKMAVPLDGITEYVTERHNPRNAKGIDFVEAMYPSAYLKQGIVLIDTPGIGSTFEHNTAVAYNALPRMDAGIFVLSVDPPISEIEYAYLDSIKTYINKIFFLLNKIDTVSSDEWHESLNFTRSLIEQKLSVKDLHIFPVSAKKALEAKLAHDTALYEESGFKAFEEAIAHFIIKDKADTLAGSTRMKARMLSDELTLNIQLTIHAVHSPLDELKNKIAVLNSETTMLEKRHIEMELLLEGEIRSLKNIVEQDMEVLKKQASIQLKTGLHSLSVEKANKKKMLESFTSYLKKGIEDVFSAWFKHEEELVADKLSQILMKYAQSVDGEINSIKLTAATLFNIGSQRQSDITELDPYSRLWYKVDDIITWGIDTIPFILPKLFFEKYILKQTESKIDEEIDRNTGRAHYDLFRRIDTTKNKFLDELNTRKAAVIDGIFKAVEKAEHIKTINEPEALEQLKVLNSYLEEIKDLTRLL